MIVAVPPARREALRFLFARHRAMCIARDAIVEGRMGAAFADDIAHPQAAFLHLGAFVLFGGDAGHPAAGALVRGAPSAQFICEDPAWEARIDEIFPEDVGALARRRFSPHALDAQALRAIAGQARDGYALAPLSPAHAGAFAVSGLHQTMEDNFGSLDAFFRDGFGIAAWHGAHIAGHASTFAVCSRGIEVQIDVAEGHRRQGLGTQLGARLVLESLRRNLAPHWDAENEPSAKLALRLGYAPAETYAVLLPPGY